MAVGKCLHCGCENLDYEPIVLDGDFMYYPVYCKSCGQTSKEYYKMVYVESTNE